MCELCEWVWVSMCVQTPKLWKTVKRLFQLIPENVVRTWTEAIAGGVSKKATDVTNNCVRQSTRLGDK